MATEIMLIKEHAHDTMIKEELGINPEKTKGAAMEVAIYYFILFAIGAVILVLPLMFTLGNSAIIISVAGSALVLFLIGSAIKMFTGKSVWFSALRQVIF
jgi:VIT1/CCC1 family predicted Fe2+/Mn2+ transporter